MVKIIRLYPSGLTDAQTANEAPADSAVVQVLAGRARSLYELATGGGPDEDTAPMTPRNPQGLYGVDHSGPPWGSALRVPIATMAGISDGSNVWTRNDQPPAGFAGKMLEIVSGELTVEFDQMIWNKPFAYGASPHGEPHGRGCIVFRARQSAARSSTLRFVVRTGEGVEHEGTVEIPASASFRNYRIVGGAEPFLRLRPGPNRIRIRISSSAELPVTTYIWSLAICQVAKRGH